MVRNRIRAALLLAAAALDLAGCYDSFGRRRTDLDAGTDTGTDVCIPVEVPARRVFPGVFVMLDRSRSMAMDTWNYWDPAREAIKQIVGSFEQDVAFGLGMFPDAACDAMTPNCCAMSAPLVGVSRFSAGAIDSALDLATNQGGTPTAPSLDAAAAPLASSIALRAAYVLLVTDGAPNCNLGLDLGTCVCSNPGTACDDPTQCLDDTLTNASLAALLEVHGVRTYVVGLVGGAGGEWIWVMNAMAEAGGTTEAFLAVTPEDVGPVMEEISGMITPCLFDVDPALVENPDIVEFVVDGIAWAHDEERVAGWSVEDPDRIRFWGPPCEAILGSGIDRLEGSIPCE